jgi:predicted P-loop ATPase
MMARGGRPSIPASAAGAPIWWDNLVLSDKGGARAILLNGDIALSQDPAFAGAIRWDAFRSQTMLCAPVPWDINPNVLPRSWTDQDDYMACLWLQNWRINLNANATHEVVEGIGKRFSYHPVMNYLSDTLWDDAPRLTSWLTYYLGVPDTPYSCAVRPAWMISAVARVFEPGCQADCVLVLEGETGIGKTSTFRILGGAWYSNDIAALGTKDAKEQIIGCWIMELDELDAVRRASDWSAVLSFVSTPTDRFRFTWGRRVQPYPRQCVFGATTNRDAWQPELIGFRRWWPVRCGPSIDLEALRRDRDQLWAEAVARYLNGERWFLQDQDVITEAVAEQKARYETDPWEEKIINYIGGKEYVTTTAVLSDALFVPTERMGKADSMRVANILRQQGWVRKFLRRTDETGKYGPLKCFVPPEKA